MFYIIKWSPLLVWAAWFAVASIPPNVWFEVRKVYVHDASTGSWPDISVDWSINHEFVGKYVASLRAARKEAGRFDTVCVNSGAYKFSPESVKTMPEPMNLRWWMGGACPDRLPDGVYYLDTSWSWEVLGAPKVATFTTNTFIIGPKGYSSASSTSGP
jgi:hypothetical protein